LGKEIIQIKEKNETFGIKSKIISYPENIFVIWIIIGVIYKNN